LASRNDADGIFFAPGTTTSGLSVKSMPMGDITIFSVIGIFDGDGAVILEDTDGIDKIYAMLLDVLCCLSGTHS
jgi:hypothetical protein